MANLFDTASPAIQQNMLRDVQEMVRHETGRSIDEDQAAKLARTILARAKTREALYRVSTARLHGLVNKLSSRVAHATINGSGKKKTGKQLDREVDEILVARQKREGRERVAQPKASMTAAPAEYERRELDEANRRLREVERAALADRKDAAARFFEDMRDHPDLVAERVGWLLDGSYGMGEKQMARRILGSPRMNRSAALTQLVAAIEWSSPSGMTRAAWKKLTKGQQAALERAVQAAIRRAESTE